MKKSIVLGMLFFAATTRGAVLAHYSFDANYTDVSGNGAGGTLVDVGTIGNSGITTNAAEKVFGGGALNLSTDRDYVSVTSRTFSSGIPYSIAFWAKKAGGDTGPAEQYDMAIGQRDTTAFYIALNNASNGLTGLHWKSSDGTTARNADFASPNDTNWHHHVITASSNTVITYYLDGSLVGNASNRQTGFIIDTIGDAYTNGSLFDFNGQIDEVWIFNETITTATVSNLFAFNNVIATSTNASTLLHYTFEGDYMDSSASSNNGSPVGSATLTTDPALVAVGSGAVQLDGTNTTYVALSTAIVFGATSPWTAAFWAKRAETNAGFGMVMGCRTNNNDFIWLNDNYAGLRFRNSLGTSFDFAVSRNTNLHHYALVAAGDGGLAFYIDGVLANTTNGNTSFRIDTVGMAYTSIQYAFRGNLDDVRVYNAAIDGPTIQALFQMHTNAPASTNVTTNVVANVTRLHVILQGGQSNSDGRGEPAGLPSNLQSPQPDIDFYYRESGNVLTTLRPGTSGTSQFGPEVTCGRGYADMIVNDSSTRVAIVKYARGGSSLYSDWKPGGDATIAGDGADYVIFQQTVSNGLAVLHALYTSAVITIDGMTWMQGESDDSVAATYQTNLIAFIADVRATIQTNLPFIIGSLSTGQTAVVNVSALRVAQAGVAAADPYAGIVETSPFPVKTADHLHFDAAGQVMLGYAFAYQLCQHQGLTNRFTPAQIAAGNAEPSADADGDGASNEAEFLAGTDATNASSVLKANITLAGPGLFSVSHPTAPARHYVIESQSDPAATNWIAATPPEAGTGTNAVHSITNNAGAAVLRIRATFP